MEILGYKFDNEDRSGKEEGQEVKMQDLEI